MNEKTCPRCPDSPTMKASSVLSILPAKGESLLSHKVVNDACGISIRAYECPACHIVELYREP